MKKLEPADINKKFEGYAKTPGRKKLWRSFNELLKRVDFQNEVADMRSRFPKITKKNHIQARENVQSIAIKHGFDFIQWEWSFMDYIFYNQITEPEAYDLCKIVSISEIINDNPKSHESALAWYNRQDNLLTNFPLVILLHPEAKVRDITTFVNTHYTLQIALNQDVSKRANLIAHKMEIGKTKGGIALVKERDDFIYKRHKDGLTARQILREVMAKYGEKSIGTTGHITKVISTQRKKRRDL